MDKKRISEGMPVVSADGRALGHVAQVESDGFVLDTGVRLAAAEVGNIFGSEVFLRKRATDVLEAETEIPGQPSI